MKSFKYYKSRAWNSATLMTWGSFLSSGGKLLILTPLILTSYSVDEIAFWYLLLTIHSFSIVIDFGFYPTFSRVISYAYSGLSQIESLDNNSNRLKPLINSSKPSWAFIEKIYGTLNTTYFQLALLVGILITALSILSVHEVISRVENDKEYLLWIAFGVFILSIVLSFLAKRSESIIIGTNHVALIQRWNILINVSNSSFSILIVLNDGGIEYLAFNQLLFASILLIRNYYLELNICNGKFKNFEFFSFDKDIFKWIWVPAWKSGVLVLTSTGLTQITGIIYSNFSNAEQLASYLLTLKLVTTISQFSQAPFYSKLPIFNGLRIQNKLQELSSITSESINKSLLVFVLGITFLGLLGTKLLELIGSNAELESSIFIVVMSVIWFLERHHAMHAQIFVTTNEIPFYKTAIITGVISIILMYLFVPRHGVWGFLIAQGLSNLVINNWWNFKISVNSINDEYWSYLKKSVKTPFLVLLILSFVILILK